MTLIRTETEKTESFPSRQKKRGLAELLAGTRWRGYAWHCFRRGGAGASWGRKPNLLYFKWWGGWADTPTAMRYATSP